MSAAVAEPTTRPAARRGRLCKKDSSANTLPLSADDHPALPPPLEQQCQQQQQQHEQQQEEDGWNGEESSGLLHDTADGDENGPTRLYLPPAAGDGSEEGVPGEMASLDSLDSRTLHVRNIGIGGCKSEALLRKVFAPYGEMVSAQIRERVDDHGVDTSWALVNMRTDNAAQSVLGDTVVLAADGKTRLQVTKYSCKQAAASKGGMKQILNDRKEQFGRVLSGARSVARPRYRQSGKKLEAGDTLDFLDQLGMPPVCYFKLHYCKTHRVAIACTYAYPALAIDLDTSDVTKTTPDAHTSHNTLDFIANETRVVTSSFGTGVMRLYDSTNITNWVQLWEFKHDAIPLGTMFSPNEAWVFSAHGGQGLSAILVHGVDKEGKILGKLPLHLCPNVQEGYGLNASVAVSEHLVVGSGGVETEDATVVKMWTIADIAGLLSSDQPEHSQYVEPRDTLVVEDGAGPVALSIDGKYFAIGSLGGAVWMYTIDANRPLSEWHSVCLQASRDEQNHHCQRVEFSNNSKLLAATWGVGICSVFSVETAACVARFGDSQPALLQSTLLDFSADDAVLATGGTTSSVRLYRLERLQPVRKFELSSTAAVADSATAGDGDGDGISSITFGACSRTHVALARQKDVVVWSINTSEEVCRIKAAGAVSSNSHFRPLDISSTHVAYIMPSQNRVAVHNLPSGKKAYELESHQTMSVSISSHTSRLALLGPLGKVIYLYDLETGAPVEHSFVPATKTSACMRTPTSKYSGNRLKVINTMTFPHLAEQGKGGSIFVLNSNDQAVELDTSSCPIFSQSELGSLMYDEVFVDETEQRLGFSASGGVGYELACVEICNGQTGKELCRLRSVDNGLFRGFLPGDNSLLLCAPYVTDTTAWSGSRISVISVESGQETEWSKLLPLVFGTDFIPFSSVGWDCTSGSSTHVDFSARTIHAVVDSAFIFVDTRHLEVAVADGALAPSQLFDLTASSPALAVKLLTRLPHCVNIRDDISGDTILHLCAREGNLKILCCIFSAENVVYTPILNACGETALDLAVLQHHKDIAAELWTHMTQSLNEANVVHVSSALALLAGKRTTARMVLPFLEGSAGSLMRELKSFRTTIRQPIACVCPSPTLSVEALSVDIAGKETHQDQTIQLWRDLHVLPEFDKNDNTEVSSRVVLLPGLCEDPHSVKLDKRTFHLIVENCDVSVFSNEIIKLVIDFKWTHNVRKIVLTHLVGYSVSLFLATVAMIASTQYIYALRSVSMVRLAPSVDALQIAVIVCEGIALGNEMMQMCYRKKQYVLDGGVWNLLDIFVSVCLMTAALAHFWGDRETVSTFGALGVAFKWFGLLDFMRAFEYTGPFVKMMSVILIDLRWLLLITSIFLLASASFFLINDGDKMQFAWDEQIIGGPWWPLFSMWRGMLGDFDVTALQQPISILMFVFFQFIVVVILMNLIIAIMGDSYEKVKENEIIEALQERAKMIVGMELLYPRGLPFQRYEYGQYLHILTARTAGVHDDSQWAGITGRVKQLQNQQTNMLMAEVDTKLKVVEASLEAKLGDVQTELASIKEILSTLK